MHQTSDIIRLISENMTALLNIRQRRQVTFPEPLLNLVGANVGDNLVAEVFNKQIILKPQKQVSLDAFKALQKVFAESGIPEKEMQDNLKRIRQKIYQEKYAKSFS